MLAKALETELYNDVMIIESNFITFLQICKFFILTKICNDKAYKAVKIFHIICPKKCKNQSASLYYIF